MILISIVVPVFNERTNLCSLHDRILAALSPLGAQYEIIFVDDGSTDGSDQTIRELMQQDDHVRLIRFSRNFGHQAALTAGLDHATGDAVVIMDGDLQHPPELIPRMIELWQQGYEIVYGIRRNTQGESLLKKVTSRFFYFLINHMADNTISSNSPDFKLLDRKVTDILKGMKEYSRFLRGLIDWTGFTRIGIPFEAAERVSGQTKYSLCMMLRFALTAVVSFSTFPLHIIAYIGLFVACTSFAYAAYALLMNLISDVVVKGWSSTLVSILFIGGVELTAIGIIGEYVGRIYEEVKQRPIYIIRERVGFDMGTEEMSFARVEYP